MRPQAELSIVSVIFNSLNSDMEILYFHDYEVCIHNNYYLNLCFNSVLYVFLILSYFFALLLQFMTFLIITIL